MGTTAKMVGLAGFAPATSRPPAVRATELRYSPKMVRPVRFALTVSCTRSMRDTRLRYGRKNGGTCWSRTNDTWGFKPVLYYLS